MNLKSCPPADTDDLICDRRAASFLRVNRTISFASDLAIVEAIMPETLYQGAAGMAFLAPSLSASARFL
ncbi:MAG: hypothetical protein WDN28_30425 [Chthoniobacter sp.]